MRLALILAASLAVGGIVGGAALADPTSSSETPSMPSAGASPSMATPSGSANSTGAASAAGAGTSASANAGGFTVGETVKDNTGAIIGEITGLKPDASGQQMAMIKMGSDTFQVAAANLGDVGGAAEINMTQAQIKGMLHGNSAAH